MITPVLWYVRYGLPAVRRITGKTGGGDGIRKRMPSLRILFAAPWTSRPFNIPQYRAALPSSPDHRLADVNMA